MISANQNPPPPPPLPPAPAGAPPPVIHLDNIRKSYWRGELEIPVLHGVTLTIRQGELVALVGASGSGKSTLMNILGCLDRPSSGSYQLDGRETSALTPDERATLRNTKIGFVFQNFNLLTRTSALNNVRMPLDYSPAHPADAATRARAETMLHTVGLADRMDHEPSALSGGQQQRVAIARSLINHPQLLLADEPTGNLDSRTADEVLRMFQQLNRDENLTIILVTHDEHVARHARRIIRMKDGLIVDETTEVPPTATAQPAPTAQPTPTAQPAPTDQSDQSDQSDPSDQSHRPAQPAPPAAGAEAPTENHTHTPAATLKQLYRTARMSLRALRRNITRSILTCLGIVIGIAAVIAMMELGGGSSKSIQDAISSLGAGMIQIDPADVSVGGVNTGLGGRATMTIADADAMRNECPILESVAPSVDCRAQAIYGNQNWRPGRILGSTPDFLVVRNWPVAQGACFTDEDVRASAPVCVIGQTIAEKLFAAENPIGKEIRLSGINLKVLGILSYKGANVMGQDQDDFLLAPLTTVKYRINGQRQGTQTTTTAAATAAASAVSQPYPAQQPPLYPPQSPNQANTPQLIRFPNLDDIWVSAGAPENIPLAIRQITALLRDRHHLAPGAPDDFRIRNHTEIAQTFASTSRVMTSLLLVVALISLAVGGVGIMNIMLVSVTERTREIGLRMAVGARMKDILRQFLIEAVVLCLAGGIAGIVLGRAASTIITKVLGWPTLLSLPAIVASVAVSCTVGIVFGFYPAWKASRLDPIEALRYE